MRASTILFNSASVRILHWLNRGGKGLTNNTQLLEFNRRSKNEAFANFLIFWGLSSHRRFLYAMIGLSLVELEFYFTRFNMAITFITALTTKLFPTGFECFIGGMFDVLIPSIFWYLTLNKNHNNSNLFEQFWEVFLKNWAFSCA